jgi:hypothetical protein
MPPDNWPEVIRAWADWIEDPQSHPPVQIKLHATEEWWDYRNPRKIDRMSHQWRIKPQKTPS